MLYIFESCPLRGVKHFSMLRGVSRNQVEKKSHFLGKNVANCHARDVNTIDKGAPAPSVYSATTLHFRIIIRQPSTPWLR